MGTQSLVVEVVIFLIMINFVLINDVLGLFRLSIDFPIKWLSVDVIHNDHDHEQCLGEGVEVM